MTQDRFGWAKERHAYWWKRCCEAYGRQLPPMNPPSLEFSNRLRTTAGQAQLQTGRVLLSTHILLSEPVESFDSTIGHEVAHIFAWRIYKDKGHGNGWCHTMRSIGLRPTRCHSYQSAKRNVCQRVAAKCPECNTSMLISRKKAALITKGERYRHLMCGTKKPIVIVAATSPVAAQPREVW